MTPMKAYWIVHADASLIQLSNLYKASWKYSSKPYLLRLITALAVELKQPVVNSLSPFSFCVFA